VFPTQAVARFKQLEEHDSPDRAQRAQADRERGSHKPMLLRMAEHQKTS
jgi:hypothetical protein